MTSNETPPQTPAVPTTVAVPAVTPISQHGRHTEAGSSTDFIVQLARDLSDDLRLTQSSPMRGSWEPVEDTGGVFFTTRSLEDELKGLLERAKKAAIDVQSGLKQGPISLRWTTTELSVLGRGIRWLHDRVKWQLRAYTFRAASDENTSITVNMGTARATPSTTLTKQPDEAYINRGGQIFTVIEVSWKNEKVSRLADEVHRCAESDRNAIGMKL